MKIVTTPRLALGLMALAFASLSLHGERIRLDFNADWKFLESSEVNASAPGFDDADWRTVDLPHDWSVEDRPPTVERFVGPFDPEMEGGHDVGWLRGGTGWYRKAFTIAPEDAGKVVHLLFDGSMVETTVWLNGEEVGRHVYGYTPFHFDLTPHLRPAGEPNQLAVKVVNPENHSRWFSGSGLYREVELILTSPLHVDLWGLAIRTPEVTESAARVELDLALSNRGASKATATAEVELFDPSGSRVARAELPVNVASGATADFQANLKVPHPERWDLETPRLYTAAVTLRQDGETVDRYEERFGIRTLHFSAAKGFLLNGRPVLLQGGCIHHDNGLLGAKAFRDAEFRRIRILRENGFNAIRSAHNPPSQHLLDACDELGMLVIDESFDMWVKPKRPNDYHRHYREWWAHDTRAMVLRGRNHPSIIMWSIGNEVQERADPEGLEIAREAIELIKSLDPTRPVTLGFNGFWDNPDKEWDDGAPTFAQIDVGGYNYQFQHYLSDHEKHPDRIMYGSESMPNQALENWRLVEMFPHIIGDFVWTAMDYLGEATIARAVFVDDPEMTREDLPFHEKWPHYHANTGDIDLLGNKKPPSFFRDVVWHRSSLEMLVQEPVPPGQHQIVYYWGWPREHRSWSWDGHEGEPLTVRVYTRHPQVRLELNGRTVGEAAVPSGALTATFEVPYAPGRLTAVGLRDGVEQERAALVTTGAGKTLQVRPESTTISADRGSLAFVDFVALDDQGRRLPHAANAVTIEVSGPAELIGAGNAHYLAEGSLQDGQFSLHEGRALAILRSTGEPGLIRVRATADGLETGVAVIRAER